jgi:hypothetical protein
MRGYSTLDTAPQSRCRTLGAKHSTFSVRDYMGFGLGVSVRYLHGAIDGVKSWGRGKGIRVVETR